MARHYDLHFLLLAAAALVTGVGMGVYMGVAHDFTLSPVHAHLNLLGWTSLALFGLAYRAYPEMAEHWLAKLHFALTAPAAFALPIGIALSILQERPGVAIAASLAWLGGCLAFLAQVARLVVRRRAVPVLLPAE